ncbi:MAG: hypothetical protein K5770_13645 [Lachnospiraceae bacterium]|nr:hypothetical protein [Lachnospiraceae bacterium]
MSHNPDIYLLYEYMDKLPFSIRIKVCLDEAVDAGILNETAQEAFARFPYYRVSVDLDEGQNYVLKPNDRPIAVLPEKDERMVLGSDEVNGHLFAITYRADTVWFNCSHSVCGGFGVMFWVKTTLYLYMCKKYGRDIEPPKDIKLPGTPVTEAEVFFPDAYALPGDEPVKRYDGGDSNISIMRTLKYLFNPFAKSDYYYEIEIPSESFIDYAKRMDASPNTLLTAMMYKAMTRFFKEKEGTFIAGRIAADYRDDIGAEESYRDYVRFIHVKYEWEMKDEPISKLNMRARGAVILQNQAELGIERFKKLSETHKGIDDQPTLKEKKKYALAHSAFRSDPRDNYTVSYVGQLNLGGDREAYHGHLQHYRRGSYA